jgi:hypothetical protein
MPLGYAGRRVGTTGPGPDLGAGGRVVVGREAEEDVQLPRLDVRRDRREAERQADGEAVREVGRVGFPSLLVEEGKTGGRPQPGQLVLVVRGRGPRDRAAVPHPGHFEGEDAAGRVGDQGRPVIRVGEDPAEGGDGREHGVRPFLAAGSRTRVVGDSRHGRFPRMWRGGVLSIN